MKVKESDAGQPAVMHKPGHKSGRREGNMKRYRFKLAIISGLYCHSTKVYLQYTRRFTIQGYEKIYY